MAQSEQSAKIIKVVVIAVAVGIIYYLFQQVSPAIKERTRSISGREDTIRLFERNNAGRDFISQYEKVLASEKDLLRKDYLKLAGVSIATIIAAFFVIHYLTRAQKEESK